MKIKSVLAWTFAVFGGFLVALVIALPGLLIDAIRGERQ